MASSDAPPVRIRLSVLHAAFDPERRARFARLHETLLQECAGLEDRVDLHVYRELDPRGSLLPWLGIMRDGVARAWAEDGDALLADALALHPGPHAMGGYFALTSESLGWARLLGRFAPTHLAFLPDDCTLGRSFVRGLLRLAAAAPNELVDLLTNHAQAERMRASGLRYYVTRDAWNGFGLMPVRMAARHLAWRARSLLSDCRHEAEGGSPRAGRRVVQHDEGVSLWAMAEQIPIVKPLPGFVQHEEVERTLDDSHVGYGAGASIQRASVSFDPEVDLAEVPWEDSKGKLTDAGRSYRGTHWSLVFDLARVTEDTVELAYECEREGGFFPSPPGEETAERTERRERDRHGVDASPHVFVTVPEYQPAIPAQRISLEKNVRTLREAGVRVTTDLVTGQSLVTRARNWGCVHRFMKSRANVLFQWDGDVECASGDALLKMVPLCEKYGIVAVAYPFRDGSGKPCATLPRRPGASNPLEVELRIEEDETCPAHEVATGFLMVHRRVLRDLMARNLDLLHQQDGGPDIGAAAWALFDTRLDELGRGRRRRYLSEDWEFSRLCREAGYQPRLYVPPILRHWGLTPCDGHVMVAWGDIPWEKVYGPRTPR